MERIEQANKLVEEGKWSNWQTAYLWLCLDGKPIEREIYVAFVSMMLCVTFEQSIPTDRMMVETIMMRCGPIILQQWVISENSSLINWRELAAYYIKKIQQGWVVDRK